MATLTRRLLLLVVALALTGCTAVSQPDSSAIEVTSETAVVPTAPITPTSTLTPTETAAPPAPTTSPTSTPTITLTPEPPLFVVTERRISGLDVPLCSSASAPALLFDDTEEAFPGQATSLLLDLANNELCRLVWADWPQSHYIQFVGGFFYYAAFDDDESAYFIWQDNGRGEGQPLPFTKTTVREQYASYFLFLVAPDGRSLVWSVAAAVAAAAVAAADEGERMTGYLMQYAQLDEQGRRRLLQEWEQDNFSYYEPLRFTADGRLLYAHQPLGLGG
jgi:hypothetical protein